MMKLPMVNGELPLLSNVGTCEALIIFERMGIKRGDTECAELIGIIALSLK